jgi:anaerobic selenocysteine-containing dehydrogenase
MLDSLKITRRTFLRVSAGTTAAAAAAPKLLQAMETELGGKDVSPIDLKERKAIPTNCHVCNIQDGAIAFVENGRVVKLEGNPEHVSTRGRLCAKGNAGMWYSYDPDRILYPLKRVGARGEGKWKRITWDEALTEVAGKIREVLDKGDPNEIMLKWGRNRTGGTLDRFMHTLGSATILNHTSVCESSKKIGMEPTWGPDIETPDFAQAKYVLNFGSNILEAAYFHNPEAQRIAEGRVDNHCKIVTFDVRLSNTAGYSDEWIPVFPGTDGAVALAMGHVILRDNLQDSDFINTWTNVTVDELKAHYKQYTPEWASKLSGVPVETIERIAREFALTKPATLFTYRGPAKHLYGSYNEKSCMMLPIMTGNVEVRGGYCLPRGMGWGQPQPVPPKPKHASYLASHPDYPLAGHKVSHLVPFWLADGKQKIKVYFTYQDNPVYTNPGAQAVWGKVLRDEKLVPYLVSMSPSMGEETALADIILPDCPYLERWEPESMPNSLWPWLGLRQPVIPALGESRENRILLRDIIHKVDPDGSRGMKKYWDFKDAEEYLRRQMDNVPGLKEAGGLEWLKKHGVWPVYGRLDSKTGKVVDKTGREIRPEYGLHKKELAAEDMAGAVVDKTTGLIAKNGKAIGIQRGGRNHVGFPTGNRLINVRVDEWAEYGFNPMPTFKQVPWHKEMKDDEMILSTFKLNVHKQSRTAAVKWLAEIAHSNPAWMNPQTAKKLGVKTGDLVRIESNVGYLVTKAYVTEGIHPKVVSIPTAFGHWEYGRLATLKLKEKPAWGGQEDPDLRNVWWDDRGVHPNAIIPAVADPIGGSQGWYDTVVKVTKAGPNDKYGDVQGDWEKHHAAYKETLRYAYTGDLHRKMHPEMASWRGPESVKPKTGGGH